MARDQILNPRASIPKVKLIPLLIDPHENITCLSSSYDLDLPVIAGFDPNQVSYNNCAPEHNEMEEDQGSISAVGASGTPKASRAMRPPKPMMGKSGLTSVSRPK